MADKTPKSNEPAIYLKSAIYPSQCNIEKKNCLHFKTGARLRRGPGKKLVKVSSAKRVFTSLNIKLFDWSKSVVSHVLKIIFEVFFPKEYNFSGATARRLQKVCNLEAWRLISRVSHETANQMGAMRGSCIRRLQS